MPSPIFQIQKEDKRMCVYSQRDFEYMAGKGWEPVPAPSAPPVASEVLTDSEPVEAPKKRGRPAKVSH